MSFDQPEVTEKTVAYGGRVVEVGCGDVEQTANNNTSERLERHINLSSIVSFGLVTLNAWEAFALTFQFGLLNGGPVAMVYGCLIASFGATAVGLSLAELASLDPTVGAQYRWSANLAPAVPKFWGLMQGWITMFAWMASAAAGPAILGNVVIALTSFNHPDYAPKAWHTTLVMWGFILLPFIFNLWFRRVLNIFEMLSGILHFVFFFVAIIPLVILAKRSTTDYVFKTFTTGVSGWTDPGVSFGLGLLPVTFALNGFDGILHMSEEVKKVRTRAPRSIIIATVSSAIMLFAFTICLLFTIGDVDKVSASPLPLIEVFYEATQSKPFTTFLVAMPTIVTFFAIFNIFASVSRLTWQFALDNGLPLSKHLSRVNPTLKLPVNALTLVGVVTFLLSIINFFSSTAFNAIISLQSMAIYVSYVLPISFLAIARIRGSPPQPGPFTLGGRIGLPVNLFAVVYLVFSIIWMPFPQMLPVTATNMNYAGPVLGAILVLALVDWFVSGHKRFNVPVKQYAL